MIDPKRMRSLKEGKQKKGKVLYWMSRDQRTKDNWALLASQEIAMRREAPLEVCFVLADTFLNAPLRAYDFMLKGLVLVARELQEFRIPFHLLSGNPPETLAHFIRDHSVSTLITDFDPLKIRRKWKEDLAEKISIPFHEVDAHNIIPCWKASDKQEYAARTFRPRVHRLLPLYLTPFPELKTHPFNETSTSPGFSVSETLSGINCDRRASPLKWLEPGTDNAFKTLSQFLENKLEGYPERRNDPGLDGLSDLSPFLHFGQISPQRVALEVSMSTCPVQSRDAFLEELIVRRELSDNFCYFNPNYDSVSGYPSWAQDTLDRHLKDTRPYVYSMDEMEEGNTHDKLWNAAQRELICKGKMHGWMRMYWAKKILEWTESAEKAHSTALSLNDRYELDGRDPNGFTGIAWSLGGVHDRAWPEREIFGKIRYMNIRGASRKFDLQRYIRYTESLG
ncbi:MAG: deoxyribodipyrimidine photo-lyase [Synergistales bacterium]|nr:deoxyribodipyrimidine photo-lyase [Synergistales bacterium]